MGTLEASCQKCFPIINFIYKCLPEISSNPQRPFPLQAKNKSALTTKVVYHVRFYQQINYFLFDTDGELSFFDRQQQSKNLVSKSPKQSYFCHTFMYLSIDDQQLYLCEMFSMGMKMVLESE